MTDLSVRMEEVPEKYRLMGGRWLTSSLVVDEVDPTCHPLGPNNKLVFAPGIVTGTPATTSAADRLPEFMKYEPLPPHNVVWDVTDEELDSVYGKLSG